MEGIKLRKRKILLSDSLNIRKKNGEHNVKGRRIKTRRDVYPLKMLLEHEIHNIYFRKKLPSSHVIKNHVAEQIFINNSLKKIVFTIYKIRDK